MGGLHLLERSPKYPHKEEAQEPQYGAHEGIDGVQSPEAHDEQVTDHHNNRNSWRNCQSRDDNSDAFG